MVPQSQERSDLENLESLYLNMAEVVAARIRAGVESDGLVRSARWRLQFNENGWEEIVAEEVNYLILLNRHDPELLSTEEVKVCARRHLDEGILEAPRLSPLATHTFEDMLWPLTRSLFTPILDAMERYETPHPTRDQIRESYLSFREKWIADSIRWTVTVPLLNFASELPHVPIRRDFELSPFGPEEKNSLSDLLGHSDFMSKEDAHGAKFSISASYAYRKGDPAARSGIDEDKAAMIGDAITALRLVKSGGVGALAIFGRSDAVGLGSVTGFVLPCLYEWRMRDSFFSPYTLEASEAPLFTELFDALQKLRRRNHLTSLSVGLRRINQSYGRNLEEDRIIDLAIALESTLLSELTDELKYRLSLRGAALLVGLRNARETKLLLDAIYDVRSGIVHEGMGLLSLGRNQRRKVDKVVPALHPADLPLRCEDVVRDVLRTYLQRIANGESLSGINTRLEDHLVSGLQGETAEGKE